MPRFLICVFLTVPIASAQIADSDWPAYGRDGGGARFSPLTQITRENVANLKVAWTFRTGDIFEKGKQRRAPSHEATPIFVDGTLFLSTPYGQVIALDPETAAPKWRYHADVDLMGNYGDFASRGVSTWVDPQRKAGQPCKRRIFTATIDAQLIALDAATGRACTEFGTDGRIDLTAGLKRKPDYKGEYQETSPPAILNDLVIVGSSVADNYRADSASGEVRAFDARTGKLRWTWDPLADTTHVGAGNTWSIISVDPQRNLVFLPTGSPSPDYYGGLRKGDDRYANSLVALDGKTGNMVWHFQTVHHDLWDYDVASQPILFNSGKRAAVAVGSKTGNFFLLDRKTGQPLFGVEERAVPKSDVPGEETSPTQPFPKMPKAVGPQRFTIDDVWGATEKDRAACAEAVRDLRQDGIFTPPSLKGSLQFPGNIGGMHWGSDAFDSAHGLLIIPTNRIASVVHLIPKESFKEERSAHQDRETTEQKGAPYSMSRYFLRSPIGLPCNPPPWGTLEAIDAATGELRWEVPLGRMPGTEKVPGSEKWGALNLGGPIVTAGGVVFIAATVDAYLRAFDVETGKELWKGELPVPGRATPMTYRSASGKQFVVISAGGFRDATETGDYVVAFALP